MMGLLEQSCKKCRGALDNEARCSYRYWDETRKGKKLSVNNKKRKKKVVHCQISKCYHTRKKKKEGKSVKAYVEAINFILEIFKGNDFESIIRSYGYAQNALQKIGANKKKTY